MIFEKKESKVEELFEKQFSILRKIADEFKRFIADYLNSPHGVDEKEYAINELEHQGDTIRRDIETSIEKGAFIPIYREDYILLAEMTDSILNRIQSTFIEIILTLPAFPVHLNNNIIELTNVSLDASIPLQEIFMHLGESNKEITKKSHKVEQKEHDADMIERELVRHIFQLEIEYAHKLHLREIIERLASFSDLAEDVGDRLQIMGVKRTI